MILADIVPEPKPVDLIYMMAIENETSEDLSPEDRETYICSLLEKGEKHLKIAQTIGKSTSWVRECERAYTVRKKYQPLFANAGITFSTKDLYALRNANEEQVKLAVAQAKKILKKRRIFWKP